MKRCPRCATTKPVGEFYRQRSGRVSSWCRLCQKARQAERWADPATRARLIEYARTYYAENRDRWKAASRTLRQQVLTEYGGACRCCGERTPEFLGIDHIYNDGEAHRRELAGYGRSIYRWLKMNGFPKDRFQLLCHNCNMAKGLYGGCPHKNGQMELGTRRHLA